MAETGRRSSSGLESVIWREEEEEVGRGEGVGDWEEEEKKRGEELVLEGAAYSSKEEET
jgi:hypothetical protein